MLADSHCHILDGKLRDRAEEIVGALGNEGLEFIVEISADPDEAREAVSFAYANEKVYCTIGVHPCYAQQYSDDFEQWALKQKSKKIVAVGECGLDYYHKDCPVDIQKAAFVRQIVLADRLGLPLVVHTRDAFDDTYEILKANKRYLNNGVLIHCFSGDAGQAKMFAEFDVYYAFGGAVTYKNNKIADGAIRAVPRNRILLETDCPYLSPEPIRGKVNEPKNVKIVGQHIAYVLDLTAGEVAKITLENTKRFYRIK